MKKTKQQLEIEKLELEIEYTELRIRSIKLEALNDTPMESKADLAYRRHLWFDSISYSIMAAALVSLAVYVWR